MIQTLAISGYRSIRELVLPLTPLNVVTGPNGSGKSSLYRAIRLLADIAQGRIIGSLAEEGGLDSTLWAGPERISRAMRAGEVPVQGGKRTKAVGLRLGFSGEDYGYAIDLGLSPPSTTRFSMDPEIKSEAVWFGEALSRRNTIAARRGGHVEVMDEDGGRVSVITDLSPFDSMMTHASDPRRAVELLLLREHMASWRFYDQLRTDREAPARRPQVATRTPILADDGHDLAAAIQTIRENGDGPAVDEAVDDAFPGASVAVAGDASVFEIEMHQPGLLRPLRAAELSDGTLRYLLLVAALLSPRPPSLLVLNEPEPACTRTCCRRWRG